MVVGSATKASSMRNGGSERHRQYSLPYVIRTCQRFPALERRNSHEFLKSKKFVFLFLVWEVYVRVGVPHFLSPPLGPRNPYSS